MNIFLKRDLFEQYLKDVDMMPIVKLGGRKRKILSEDEYSNANNKLAKLLRQPSNHCKYTAYFIFCLFVLLCTDMFLMYYLPSYASGDSILTSNKYIILGLITPICFLILTLWREVTIFNIIFSVLANTAPDKAVLIISEIITLLLFKRD
ncbi:MAG: hypothetical protein H7843_06140 [Nitrospirota bacterium]